MDLRQERRDLYFCQPQCRVPEKYGRQDTGYLFVAQEITAKKRVEESFRVASLQMSGVIYNLPDPDFCHRS